MAGLYVDAQRLLVTNLRYHESPLFNYAGVVVHSFTEITSLATARKSGVSFGGFASFCSCALVLELLFRASRVT